MIYLFLTLMFVLCVFYIVILIRLIRGLSTLDRGKNNETPSVSVVVPARNEENNILRCLEALHAQDYPEGKSEIIIVNDRSTDRTEEIIRTYVKDKSNMHQIKIHETHAHMAPKKWALQTGIQKASGEIILTTDADCIPRPGWIRAMTGYFNDHTALVAGYSPLTLDATPSILHQFVKLESLALAGVMAGSFGAGFPLTCSGRNLAYRKSEFERIGGFKQIAEFVSGDDDLFLHLLQKESRLSFRFAIHAESVVPSRAPESFSHFSNQRVRHASKGLFYKTSMKLALIGVYLLNVGLLISLFFQSLWPWLLVILCAKSAFEFLLIFKTAGLFSQRRLLWFFLPSVILYPPYVVWFGLKGQFGKFKWKNETFKTKK